MTELFDALRGSLAALSTLELLAVLLAVAYLLLAIRQNRACWWCAVASAGLYIKLMYDAGLYMESALQVFYIGMAVYGWWMWRPNQSLDDGRVVTNWPLAFHVLPIFTIVLLTLSSGAVLSLYTDAAFPYADSFTTWGAVVATWLVARKVLQNWHYWFVIDAISVYLYASRELLLTAILFSVYLLLIIIGYRAWRAALETDLGHAR